MELHEGEQAGTPITSQVMHPSPPLEISTAETAPEPSQQGDIGEAHKWSWSSWLLGAPPLPPEAVCNPVVDPVESSEPQATTSNVENHEVLDPLHSTASWLWKGASQIVTLATEKSTALMVNAAEEVLESDEKEDNLSSSQRTIRSAEEMEQEANLWGCMRRDLNELACSVMPPSVHLSDTVHKLHSTMAACWDGFASSVAVALTEEELEQKEASTTATTSNEDSELFQIHTFEEPPQPKEEFDSWLRSFEPLTPQEVVESNSETLTGLLMSNQSMSSAYCCLVPRHLSYVDFFLRYLFRKYQLDQAKGKTISPMTTDCEPEPMKQMEPVEMDDAPAMQTDVKHLRVQEHEDLVLVRCSSSSSALSENTPEHKSVTSLTLLSGTSHCDSQKESEDDWEKCN